MWNVRLTTASKAARGRGVDSSAPKVPRTVHRVAKGLAKFSAKLQSVKVIA